MNTTLPADCRRADPWIEPLASGEPTPAETAAHVARCPHCTFALDLARATEAALRQGLGPAALPPGFPQRVAAALRQERWAAEERFDRVFNLGMAAAVVVIVASVAALFNLPALSRALASTQAALEMASAVLPAANAMTRAVALGGVMVTIAAASVWWWAERTDALS